MTFDQRLQADTLRPAWAVHLEIDQDPVSVWTGPGTFAPAGTTDAALNGKVFESVGSAPVIGVGPVTDDDNGVSPLTLAVGGADLNEDGARQFIRDRRSYQGRDAYVWFCLLDVNYSQAFAERYYTGAMSVATLQDGDEPIISLPIDRDIRLVQTPPRKLSRQSEIWPGDTFSDWIVDAANGDADRSPPVRPVPKSIDFVKRFFRRGFF
ncbi:MAG: hypothetical protein AAF862_18045 [Pseudomonadota bacterium]